MRTLPFDEIEILKATLESKEKLDSEETIDAVLDILILSYINGIEDANEMLGTSEKPNASRFKEIAYKKIDGKTFADRVKEYAPQRDIESIIRVAETESHRDYNTASFETAQSSNGKVYKTWNTMLDNRVRDEHQYMEGQTVPLDGLFYSYDGHSAEYPGGFGVPELDIGCRCFLTYKNE